MLRASGSGITICSKRCSKNSSRSTRAVTKIAALHARASQWHENHGDIEESIRHTLAAGDVSTAAQIIKSQRGPAFNEDRWISVRDWLAMMPEEAISQHTGLLLARAWVFFAKSQFAFIQGILEQLELCPDEIEEGEAGEIALFEAIVFLFSGEAKNCVERSEDALALIPRSNICFRSEAEIFRGLGLQMNGQGDRAIRILEDSLRSREYGNPVPKSRLIVCQAYLHLLSARLPEARAASVRLSRIPGANVFVSCWAWTMRGLVHWYGNDLEKAVSQFSAAADRRYLFGTERSKTRCRVITVYAGAGFPWSETFPPMTRGQKASNTATAILP